MDNMWKSSLLDAYDSECTVGVNDGCQSAQRFGDGEAEYQAVRHSVAISDNCHYGKFRVSGANALDCVNQVVMGDVSRLAIGRATWTFVLREDGSILCDVYVVCAGDEYLIFSEGAMPADVKAALDEAAGTHTAQVEDLTAEMALIGLDGPYAWELLKELVGVRMLGMRYLEFLERQPLGSGDATIIRAGKTGEFGYQVLVPAEQATSVWNQLLEAGKAFDIHPIGYETLNLCRLENRFINIHCEGTASKNPLELNCRVMIDREKDSYTGENALNEAMQQPLINRIIGMTIEGGHEAMPEVGAQISLGDKVLGRVVNVGFSPSLGKPIALALMAAETAYVGIDFDVQSSTGYASARTVSAPFVFNKSMSVRPQEDSYRSR